MNIMNILQVLDRMVPYETFLDDLSARIVRLLERDRNDPEFVSQRTAFKLFGRGNVERWKKQGRIVAFRRPGKIEYRTSDLRLLQRTEQDYFEQYPAGKWQVRKKSTGESPHEDNKR